MADILEAYDQMISKPEGVTIHKKRVNGGVYYFEFTDVTYIKVEISETARIYKCEVLDPTKEYMTPMHTFEMSFDYVIEVGNFEEALKKIYNQVVKPIVMNALTIDTDEENIRNNRRDIFKPVDPRSLEEGLND